MKKIQEFIFKIFLLGCLASIIFAMYCAIWGFWRKMESDRQAQQLDQEIREKFQTKFKESPGRKRFGGHMTVLEKKYRISEKEMQDRIIRYSRKRKKQKKRYEYGTYSSCILPDKTPIYFAARGTDKKYHFVNGYLEGYAPFATEKLWVPLYVVAGQITYQLDSKQFQGYSEIWQTSRQAFANLRGDCEDHSIILTDWLVEMGYDARVAVGYYKKEGHAWVVLFKDEKTYLLEATDKRRLMHNAFTLAKMKPNYHPEYMFNRDFLWVNTGSSLTVNYTGKRWIKKSRYIAPKLKEQQSIPRSS